jgi:hypothetical protein
MGAPPCAQAERYLVRSLLADSDTAKDLWKKWRANTNLRDVSSAATSVIPLFGDELNSWIEDDAGRHVILGIRKQAWSLNRLHLHEVWTAAEALRETGIPSMAAGLAASALLLPSRRLGVWQPALLVRRSEALQAALRLNAMGWRGDPPQEETLNTHSSIELERAEGSSLSLCWDLFPCPVHLSKKLEDMVWQTRRKVSWNNKFLSVPAPTLQVVEILSRGEDLDAFHLCETLLMMASVDMDWRLFRYATALSFQPHIVGSSLAHLRKHWGAPVPRRLLFASRMESIRPYRRFRFLRRDYEQWICRTERHRSSRTFLEYLCRRWQTTHVLELPGLAFERLLRK